MDKSKRKLRGFTLIELVIVITIISILTAILVPNVIGYIRTNRIIEANEQAQQIYKAAQDFLVSEQVRGTDTTKIVESTSQKVCWIVVSSDKSVDPETYNIDDSYKDTFVKGVESRMEIGLAGSWAVAFYPNTFTVAYACYNEFYDSSADQTAAVKFIGTNGGKQSDTDCSKRLYEAVFGKASSTKYCQEGDFVRPDSGETDHIYTGQYPVKGSK